MTYLVADYSVKKRTIALVRPICKPVAVDLKLATPSSLSSMHKCEEPLLTKALEQPVRIGIRKPKALASRVSAHLCGLSSEHGSVPSFVQGMSQVGGAPVCRGCKARRRE